MVADAVLTDAVRADLHKACDGQAAAAGPDDAVAGIAARFVATPSSTQQSAEVLRVAAQHGLRVVARGAGTKLGWGMPPVAVDLVVDTTAMTGVVEHAAGDLITIARAGTPLADLQDVLAQAGQQLALDAPVPGATVGGTVATSTSGPRRLLYGTMRDLLIGITFVRADGVVAKAGGKVVKNVAGYDFAKLLAGSYGTLGLVTEVALRLHPLPAARHVAAAEYADSRTAAGAAAAVLGSQVVPSAVEIDQPVDGPCAVAVLLEGVAAGVAGRAQTTTELLGAAGGSGDAPSWFGAYPFGADDIGLKVTTMLTGVAPLLAAARDLAAAHGVHVAVRGSASGVLYAGMAGDTDPPAAAAVVEALRAHASSYAGSVVVLTAPPVVRDAVDVWGPVPGLDLMRRVKDQFDPDHRLAPGRFVGGI